MLQIGYVVENNLNIRSGYRKLNDYKGASCGQHSALSTQHSALSTQHSALSTQHSALSTRIRSQFFIKFAIAFSIVFHINIGLAATTTSGNVTYSVYDETTTPGLFSVFFGCKINGGTWEYGTCQPYTPIPFSDGDIASRITTFWNSSYTCGNGKSFSIVEDTGFLTGNIERTDLTPGNSSWSCKSGSQVKDITVLARRISVSRCDGSIFVHSVCKTMIGVSPLTLSLTPAPNQKDPRPLKAEGKDGKSTSELIAKVMEGSTPKAGVAVTFKVKVKEGSGEHGVTGGAVHDHKVREENHSGKVPPSGVTNGSGEARIKFEAPILAGTHTITATCDTCSNKTATKDVKVLVPDLVALTADKGIPKMFELIGNTSGSGLNHPNNHYFTEEAKLTLTTGVIPKLFNAGWGVVGVNDGSLKDGGLFDIQGFWAPSHHEHRTGTEVDIRTNNIAEKKVREVYENLCSKETTALDVQTLWHKSDIPAGQEHYHIYLSGAGLDLTKTLGKCCEKYRVQKKDKDGVLLFHTSGKLKGKPIYEFFCEEKTPSN